MKLAPKHFRLMSLIAERGSVPGRIKPVVRNELLAQGLAEYFQGEEWTGEPDRYRLTVKGEKAIESYDENIRRDKFLSSCQGRK